MTAAGWALVRADALLPREIDPFLPPAVRLTAQTLRILSRRSPGRPGERLAGVLEKLGPAAIKLGQLLATRADIFGEGFANDLGHLKDRLEPFPLAVARAEIERSLGRPIDHLFTEIGEPVAAASIAQAHPATLIDGRKVAIKVLRPGIEQQVAKDAEALFLAARMIERHVPPARRLEPVALVTTVVDSLKLELDLRLEAGGADELAAVMAKDGYMTAPAVVWTGVGKRTLTLEWAQGVALSEQAALDQPGLDRPATAIKLVRAFLTQALDHGVFHADLHEGNLFVSAPDRIVAVDFGIIGRLAANERRYLAEILWGFITRDYAKVARAHFEAGYVPKTCAQWASRCSARSPTLYPWAACWPSCSKSPPCSTCTCARNWCSCRRPWSPWKASAAGSTPTSTSGKRPSPSSGAISPGNCRPWSRAGATWRMLCRR